MITSSATVAARLLEGDATGNQVRCPGPGHSAKDRSLSVRLDPGAPDGFVVYSFAGDDWRLCRDHVKAALGLPVGRDGGSETQSSRIAGPDEKARYALKIWEQALPAAGSPVETYLASRGLGLPSAIDALRYHPECPFFKDTVTAMVAAMWNSSTGEFQGVHRTRLNPKGKAMLGPSKGAVVKLSLADPARSGLNVCEGIETGLSLVQLGFDPVWCTLSASGMAAFGPVAGIEALTVFADNDASKVGESAATECAARWISDGRAARVFITPEPGTDFADLGGVS